MMKDKLEYFDEMKSMPFDDKLEHSLSLIENVLNEHKCCVACSFGKDSVVMLHLVRRFMPDIPVIFSNTGVEFKETLEFKEYLVKKWNLNYTELKPEKTFWQCVEEYGYPKQRFKSKGHSGWKPKCCYYLKVKPPRMFYRENNIECVFLGITHDESYQRKWQIIRHGDYYYVKGEKIYKALPLAYWNEDNVWKYIEMFNLPVNPAYKKYGINRVGCIPCTSHKKWEEQMMKLFPKLYRKIKKDMLGSNLEDYGEIIEVKGSI